MAQGSHSAWYRPQARLTPLPPWKGEDLFLFLPQATETVAGISESAWKMSVLKLKCCCVETMATRGGVCLAPSTSQ